MLYICILCLFKVLCLSPTYELAIQTGEVAAHMAKFCPEIELRYAVRGEEGILNIELREYLKIILLQLYTDIYIPNSTYSQYICVIIK